MTKLPNERDRRQGGVIVRVRTDGPSTVTVRVQPKKVKQPKPNGVILYRGRSLLNGERIVVVATGLVNKSDNPKTGRMIQTYILHDRVDPMTAKMKGLDEAVCGDCPHRAGSCYVNVVQGPLSVFKALKRGRYPKYNHARHARYFAGRKLRLGTYGDPAAVPLAVWEGLAPLVSAWCGYTHQWRSCDPGLARFCMASCDTAGQLHEAWARGWRTFRVRRADEPLQAGEFTCPASAEAGKRLTCEECKACSGAKSGGRNASPSIIFHGSRIADNWSRRVFERVQAGLIAEEQRQGVYSLPTLN